MPTALPKLSFSICRRMVPIAILPAIVVGIACWSLMLRDVQDVTAGQHRLITSCAAHLLQEKLRSIDSLLRQTTFSVNDFGRIERSSILNGALQSSRHAQALLILSPDRTVRDVAMRDDLAVARESLIGLDLSGLVTSLHRAPDGVFAHGPRSPIDGRPVLVAMLELRSGELLLALLDVPAIVRDLRDSSPGQHAIALWFADCSSVLHADEGSELLLSGIQGVAPPATQGQAIASAHVLDSLHLSVAGVLTRDPAISGTRLVALLIAAGTAIITGVISVIVGLRVSRPIASLAGQMKQAIARQEQARIRPQPFVETEAIAHIARQLVIGTRDTQDRLATIQQAIQTAAAPLSRAPAGNPLEELASSLASVTGARCVLIAEWVPGVKPRAHVLASRANVPLPDEFIYELPGNPAHLVTSKPLVHVRTRVLRDYPESTLLRMLGAEGYVCVPLTSGDGTISGHLEIIDEQDIVMTDSLRDLLALFAARATGELERIRAQRQCAEAQAHYSAVTLDQQEIVCRWAADTTLTFVNDAMCRVVGLSREQLLGRSLLTLLHEEDRDLFQQRVRELSAPTPVIDMELRLMAKAGVQWYRWTSRALLDTNGRITDYQGTAQDITRIRQLIANLDDAGLRFTVLAENCPVAFWITDWTTQRCTYTNPMFRKLWGITPEAAQVASMAWTSVVHQDDRPQVVRRYLLHAVEGQYRETYRIVRPDGTVATIRDRAIPLTNSEGRVDRIANIAYEVSPGDRDGDGPYDDMVITPPMP